MKELIEHTIRSSRVFSGILLEVYRDNVEMPDGREAVREWIDHPGASAVVPVFEDRTTLLVEQYRYASRRTFLEVPAGKLDPGESPETTAVRELEEETGWKAGRLVSLGALYPCIGYSNEVIHVFMAQDLTESAGMHDDDEFLTLKRLPLLQVEQILQAGEFLDMKTALALRMAFEYLSKEGSYSGNDH